MNLFVIVTGHNGGGEPYLRDIAQLVPPDHLEVFHDVPSFAERLRKPKDPLTTLLLLRPSHEDLKNLVALLDLLKDARILLVLDDQSDETIALAHKVRPTYISYVDNGTGGVIAVLKQLLRDVRAREAWR